MSQAFVKEGDGSDDLPERPVSDRPNYVTPAGLADLRRRHEELSARRSQLRARPGGENDPELKLVERDLRYFEARLARAILVDRKGARADAVRFGTRVRLEGVEGGAGAAYQIVGEDESDPAQGRLSWSSPLAMALMGKKPGETVVWDGPEGAQTLKILSVD